jgi:hypothetical protein
LFRIGDLFDPDDLVQVKYEMLRRLRLDKQSVSQSASAFGFSRPTFYQAGEDFQRDGLAGLLPSKRGPHQGHKLTPEVLDLGLQLERLSGKIIVDAFGSADLTMHVLKHLGALEPRVQLEAADPERIVQVLLGPSTKPIE